MENNEKYTKVTEIMATLKKRKQLLKSEGCETIEIGSIVFNNETTVKNYLKRLTYPYFNALLESKEVLKVGDFSINGTHDGENQLKKQEWLELIQLIKIIKVTEFHADNMRSELILKKIEFISFPNLKLLNLFASGINNVESLAFLDAPNLKNLNLIENHLTSLKCLSKANFRNLKALYILVSGMFIYYDDERLSKESHENLIHTISRWNIDLDDLRLEKYQKSRPICQDLSILAKTKKPISNVHIFQKLQKKYRINQSLVRYSLKRRASQETKEILFKQFKYQLLNNGEFINVDSDVKQEQIQRRGEKFWVLNNGKLEIRRA